MQQADTQKRMVTLHLNILRRERIFWSTFSTQLNGGNSICVVFTYRRFLFWLHLKSRDLKFLSKIRIYTIYAALIAINTF